MKWQRRIYQWCWLPIYRFWALRHIRQHRLWRSHGLTLEVPPGVFHPGIFFSTPLFFDFLAQQKLSGLRVLDMGTGSGALAVFAAQAGSLVTAVDINPLAVATAIKNAERNSLNINSLESDLFDNIATDTSFGLILVNPPYYPVTPKNDAEKAFFAGENMDYFPRFFQGVTQFLQEKGQIWMILSEDCDWATIDHYGQASGFRAQVVYERWHWGERLFVAEFRRSGQPMHNKA